MQPVLAVTDATVSSFLPRALLLRASELRLIVLCWKEIRPSGVSIAGIMTLPYLKIPVELEGLNY